LLGGAALALAALAFPAASSARPPDYLTTGQSVFSGTTIGIKGGDNPAVLDRVVLTGRIPIPGANQLVNVVVTREGHRVLSRMVPTDSITGRYRLRMKLTGCCSYTAQAIHGADTSYPYTFVAQGPQTLEPGPQTLLFNRLLQRAGYHMEDVTDHVDESTDLAIIAMRKVNDLPRSESYDPSLFTMLLRDRGAFEPVHDQDGRYVEVDLSRQVMALIEDGKPTDVIHVSTGAFGTPTGTYHFYSRGPGYNAKGMYYSVSYSGNYATHGYASVPYYPASHGCIRNPESDSVYIYNWISLGDPIYIYE
jgi:N-acetylmuramoyl-L-alanine amidase